MADEPSSTVTVPVASTEEAPVPPASDVPPATTAAESDEVPPKADDGPIETTTTGSAPQTNGTPTVASQKEKRKSIPGTSEPKNKKLNRKSSVMNLNLSLQPGDLVLAKLKSFPWWPAIICDEPMLPEDMLSKRPVSGMRPDGSYREDFLEGGKNVRDRRYAVMFLHNMDFYWVVNSDIRYLTVDVAKQTVEEQASKKTKMTKDLQAAYKLASEEHDFDYYKGLLKDHEDLKRKQAEEFRRWEEEQEALAQKAEEDVEMPDAEAEAPAKKKEKKRKAPKEDLDEEGKPLKTPKKIKIKPIQEKPTPSESSAKPKKAKKEKPEPPKSPIKAEVKETAEEIHEKMKKTILFLRHKLQKGFLSRDKPPEESEMPTMHGHMNTLENYSDLDGSIIRATKINKVLKAIMKLATIPREHEFQFKKRSQDVLTKWSKQLEDPAGTSGHATTNGDAGEVTPAVETNGTAEPQKGPEPAAPVAEDSKKDGPPTEAGADSKADEPIASVEPAAA